MRSLVASLVLSVLLVASPARADWPGWLPPFDDGIASLEAWTIANIERIADVFNAQGFKTVGPGGLASGYN